MTAGRVAVVGGGLAGITAALDCAEAGCAVTLFEARPRLGGLTHSFRRGRLEVDNGQHVFLRCCTAYRALLERLGTADRAVLQPRLAVPVRIPGEPRTALLRRGDLPAPLHLAGTLARYRPLRWTERARAAVAAMALRRVDPADPRTDERSFGAWLREHGQGERAVAALWDLIGVATLNARADDAGLAGAATVFRRGLLEDRAAGDVGWSTVPLGALHGEPALARLAAAGADVRTGAAVRAVERAGDAWHVRTDGAEVACDAVVLAVPPVVAERLLPPGALDAAPGWAARLGTSPIVNVHVVLDRRVLDEPFVAGVGTPLQWVFDRTGQSGLDDGQYLAASISAADGLVDMPTPALRERLLPELAALLPATRAARVVDFFVTRERHATFRQRPGSERLRPGTATRAPRLFLAGAWTATGWPATMEGAVRSGTAAAAAVLGSTAAPRVPAGEREVAA
ncbi:hydroxysqualene dehydroxylase HpnE [Pseudonocardia adelaidensis]|uniref:Hydroxysqualene dehydroxylase HpnE n=1 Tax=Pseudonocardia adelaidensis TaxID=648754 RepID=A0ABP9NH22_9PSEU